MTRIYTKSGDQGTTSLIGGKRVAKSHDLLEAYGSLDELNSLCGLALTHTIESLTEPLIRIQNQLFTIGSHLACENEKMRESLPKLAPDATQKLEDEMDQLSLSLQPLNQFILPGGSELGATLHIARTVSRRCERRVYKVVESGEARIEPEIMCFLNRLSDWFFVSARYANTMGKIRERVWVKDEN